jgi:hypothetical protein
VRSIPKLNISVYNSVSKALQQAIVTDMSNTSSTTDPAPSSVATESKSDMSSVLVQIKSLQEKLASRDDMLMQYKQQVEELEKTNEKLGVAQRSAMKDKFEKEIQTWITSWPESQFDQQQKSEILEKAASMANKGIENGVWKLLCCASSIHKEQVNSINKLTEDYNSLKQKLDGGEFRHEESRKRKEPEAAVPDAWSQLENMCKNY